MRWVHTGIITLLCLGLCGVNLYAQEDANNIIGTSDDPQLQTGQEFYEAALAAYDRNEADSSHFFLKQAKSLFQERAYDRGLAECYKHQVNLHYDVFDIPAMKEAADSSYQLFLGIRDTMQAGRMAKMLGLAVELEGEYVDALHHYRESYQLAESVEDIEGMAYALNNTGLVYEVIDDNETARNYLFQALALAKKAEDDRAVIGFELNIGNTYEESVAFDSARYYYQSVFERSKAADEFSGYRKAALCNISNIHLIREEYEPALDYAEQAMNFVADVDPTWQVITLYNVAEAYFGLSDYEEAYYYLSDACERSENMNFLEGIITCKELKAKYYREMGNDRLAYQSLEAYHSLRDSLRGGEINQQLQIIKARDELANLNEEIASLEVQQAEAEMTFKRNRNSILIIGGSLLLLLASFFYYYRSRTQVRLAMDEKKLAESRLAVMRSQMNPKFIYNAYGSTLQFFLNMGERDVYDYLSKFGALLRSFVGASSQTYIDLDKEVNFLQTYLDLEKIRLSGDLSFHIEVEPDLLERNPHLPSMMVHPFVEGVVRQRRDQPDQQGELFIGFTPHSEKLICCRIKDHAYAPELVLPDGVAAAKNEDRLATALQNGRERLAFLRKLGYAEADIQTNDFINEQGNKGREFLLYLPLVQPEEG